MTDPVAPEEFRAEVRRFLTESLPPGFAGIGALPPEDIEEFVADWRSRLVERGLLARSWPREWGGAGLTPAQQTVLSEEFASVGVPMGGSNDGFGLDMLGNTLLQWGTPEQKAHFLPRILTGEDVWCQGFSEPEAGSDLAGVRTRAVLGAGGWVINGQKIWTSNAHRASWIFLLARTDPQVPKHRGLTFLLVPLRQSGIEIRPIRQMSGDSHFNEVFFTDALAPADHVVGGVGNGWKVAMSLLGFERGQAATTQAIRYRAEFDRLVRTAREHGALDRSGIREQLTETFVRVEVLRGLAARVALGGPTGTDSAGDAALFKLYWSQHHQKTTKLALEILGPEATVPSGPLLGLGDGGPDAAGAPISSASWVDIFYNSRAGTIYAGTSEVLKNVVSERILKMPK